MTDRQHAPQNRREFARAARSLVGQGLTAQDAAELLGLTPCAVRELLAERLPREPRGKQ